MRGRLVGAVGAALALVLPASAAAMPGDPGFAPLTPTDGASVPVNPNGVPVTFTCPVYRISDPLPVGGPSSYTAGFSRSPALGTDGRLREDGLVARGQGETSNTVPEGQCVSALAAGGSERPQETPGVYYWQVWRLCLVCPGGYEVGPVWRFTLRAQASVAVRSPGAVFAGYPVIVPLRLAGVPNGSPVRLQRRAGSRWRTVASGQAVEEQAELVANFRRGTQRLRVVAQVGDQAVVSGTRTLRVRAARRWSTGRGDDGSYSGRPGGEQSVRFQVAAGGRSVRGFRAHVAMLCPGITPGTFTTQIGTAILPRMRIAPDGRFVGAATPNRRTSIRARGRIRRGKATGRVELSIGPCSGSVAYRAS